MTSVFLSYARGDDGEPFDPATSFVARLHSDLTAAGFAMWFDRVSMPSRSLTFHQEIRDAVAACDRLVLVVGPKAAESLYVRQEWQFAYFEAEKIVTPILRSGDYPNVPDELKLLHCEDFRDDGQYDFHLKNLLRQLAEPAPALGKLIGVPSLPAHFLSRTDCLTALRDALRADLDRPVVITGAAARVGMHGMGGIGKSVLAATLSRDRKIREAFPDGIVWVGLGPLPAVADLQRRVHKDLDGDGAFQTEHEGRVKLRDILKDKGVLLILDDVWRRADVDWFDVLGPRCRAMITTRDAGLLTSLGGVHHQVELLTDAEALNLLAQAAGVERDKLPSETADLIAECGRLPLAVALCGGLIRHGFAWAKVLEQLRTSRIDRIKDPHAAKVEHENIWNAIDVSVKFLSADEQARFLELAVFPPDEATPIAALQTLWSHTAGFDDWDTDALVIKLSQRSLLELTTSVAGKAISLHDLVYDYVHRAAGDETALHQRLLEAYRRKCPDGWHVNPPNDGYFFTHLRHHLIAAGLAGELADLLRELRWLEAKNEATLTFDLTADFDGVIKALLETDIRQRNLRLLHETLRRDIHFIARHAKDYPQGLFQCLWNSCWWYDCSEAGRHYDPPNGGWGQATPPWDRPGSKLNQLLEQWRGEKEARSPGSVWVRSLRPPDTPLGGGCLAKFEAGGAVFAVAISLDGSLLAAGGKDGVRIWEIATGRELRRLRAKVRRILDRVHFSPDGRLLVVNCAEGVRVWNWLSDDVAQLTRSEEGFRATWSPDGARIAAVSRTMLRVWDWSSRALVAEGHFPESPAAGSGVLYSPDLAFYPDGQRLVTCNNSSVHIWDSRRVPFAPLTSDDEDVRAQPLVAVSPCGTQVALTSVRREVCIYADNSFRTARRKLHHHCYVSGMTFSPDGRELLTVALDGYARAWDVNTGRETYRWEAARGTAWCMAVRADSSAMATGGDDGVVRLWDLTSRSPTAHLRGHPCRLPATGMISSEGHVSNKIKILGFSPDGRCLYTEDLMVWHECPPGIGRWNAETGRWCGWATEGKPEVFEGESPCGIRVALERGDTVFRPNGSDQPLAHYAFPLNLERPHPSLPVWAGGVGSHLHLVTLEGRSSADQGSGDDLMERSQTESFGLTSNVEGVRTNNGIGLNFLQRLWARTRELLNPFA